MSHKSVEDRFTEKVSEAEGGCHEWQSTLHRDGYGKFYYQGDQQKAHRVAYELFVGEIPEGAWVLHTCDNRSCVNPDHLYLGDARQNALDKVERCPWWGRMTHPFEVVQEARRLCGQGWTQQKVADRLGLTQSMVSKYVRGAIRLSH